MNTKIANKSRVQFNTNITRKEMLRKDNENHKYTYEECKENIINIVKNNNSNTGEAENLIIEELQKFRKSELPDKISKEIYEVRMGFYDIPGFKRIGMHIRNGNWSVEFETTHDLITRYTMLL